MFIINGKSWVKFLKNNHFQSVCKSKVKLIENINGIKKSYFCLVLNNKVYTLNWTQNVFVEIINLNFELDTDCNFNILPFKVF